MGRYVAVRMIKAGDGLKNVYLGIGSNIGDRFDYLKQAVRMLDEADGVTVINQSSLYETKPVGYIQQDNFLNSVVHIETKLEPYDLLKTIGVIEQQLERKRLIRWGPRTIDIDILLYDTFCIEEDKLTIPHKEMWHRGFVLIPLLEIYSHQEPLYDKIKASLEQLEDTEGIVKIT